MKNLSFPALLTLVFVTLKLTGTIAWSWWWVLAPLWIPASITLALAVLTFICAWFANQAQSKLRELETPEQRAARNAAAKARRFSEALREQR